MSERKYTLVWEDDFNGESINRDNWGNEIGFIRNHELQYYTDSPENAYIEDGCLVIRAVPTGKEDVKYTSASLNTYGKRSFLYGRIEMRAKLPYGKGIWPAFWTLGTDIRQHGWPFCGEIDIMELIGTGSKTAAEIGMGDGVISGTIHYPNKKDHLKRCELLDGKYADDFHIIGMEWTKQHILWYVDGIIYNKVDISDLPSFHKEHYILLNIAVGGDWPGSPDESTVFPQRYIIDWVRYYKCQENL